MGVSVVVARSRGRHHEVLGEVRDTGGSQRLVGAADAENGHRGERARRVGPQARDSGQLDLPHLSPAAAERH